MYRQSADIPCCITERANWPDMQKCLTLSILHSSYQQVPTIRHRIILIWTKHGQFLCGVNMMNAKLLTMISATLFFQEDLDLVFSRVDIIISNVCHLYYMLLKQRVWWTDGRTDRQNSHH